MARKKAPDGTSPSDDLHDILARFVRYHPSRIDLSLDRIIRLLGQLGDPQHHLPPVVHVAGTNGKGSTIAFLRAIFEAGGHAVSTYTSPHLVDFTERFVLAGKTIGAGALRDLFLEVEAVNDGQPITEFEIITAAAFVALARTPADIVLLETGLGGRYDATNVIDAPLATVITPISRDHEAFLGTDIAAIAGEKAAIQKTGVPSIVAPQPIEAAKVIERVCSEVGAIAFRAGREWTIEPAAAGFVYRAPELLLELPAPALKGPHQIVNAGTAVACATQCRRVAVDEKAIAAGIAGAHWAGRFEALPDGPLRRRLPAGWRVWLDAAHNPAGGAALAATLRQINGGPASPLHIVFGMMADKDAAAFVGPLAALAASVTVLALPNEARSHDPASVVAALARAGVRARQAASLEAAFDALAASGASGRVVVCGSHALVGAALQANALAR